MKLKSLYTFVFKATPARIALAITFYYGLLLIAPRFNGDTGSYFYFIIFLPVLMLGCGEFWGGHPPYCIRSTPLLLIAVLSIIFLVSWIVLKIISLFLNFLSKIG